MNTMHRLCKLKGVKNTAKLQTIKDLLSSHPEYVNVRDDLGRTPMTYFLEFCDTIDQKLESIVLDIVNTFLEHVDVDLTNHDGHSIVWYTRLTKTYRVDGILLRYYVQNKIYETVDPFTLIDGRYLITDSDDTIPGSVVIQLMRKMQKTINDLESKIKKLELDVDTWTDIF